MKILSLTVIALALAASIAGAAGGVNLSWNKCVTNSTSLDMSDACDGSRGSPVVFTGSFRPDFSLDHHFGAVSSIVDVVAASATLPDFWSLTGCAAAAFSLPVPTASAPCAATLFPPSAPSGSFQTATVIGPNHVRFEFNWATAPPTAPSLVAGSLYVAFDGRLDVDADVAGGCTGCTTAMCLSLNSLVVYDIDNVHTYTINQPDVRNYITWQGGPGGCPAVTPVPNRTWGSVKALYR